MGVRGYVIRILLGVFYICMAVCLFHWFGRPILNGNEMDLLLFSAIVTLIINTFFAGFFETPKDIIASSVNVLILLAPFINIESNISMAIKGIFIYAFICLILASVSVILYEPSGTTKRFFLSNWFKNMAGYLGNSRLLFGLLIGIAVLSLYSSDVASGTTSDNVAFYLVLLGYFLAISSERIQKLIETQITGFLSLLHWNKYNLPEPVGRMVAVQSKDTFIIDLVDSAKRKVKLRMFDFVEFRYGADDNMFVRGFIIDRYSLDSQQKVKVLGITKQPDDKNHGYENNIVYKIPKEDINERENEILQNFVGTVIEQSDISKIRFEYSPNKLLTNGDLLSVEVKMRNEETKEEENAKVLYQITQAVTDVQKLESHNEIGLIISHATQLGVWHNSIRNFENYGWVPAVNTRVMVAKDVIGPDVKEGELELGKIENTEFKVVVDINNLVTHHTAILGTTGTGKSVFARNIIQKLADNNTKVFCIDFTGEMKRKMRCEDLPLNTRFNAVHITPRQYGEILTSEVDATLMEHIAHYALRKDLKIDRAERDFIADLSDQIVEHIKEVLCDFVRNNPNNICLFELQELSNTDVSLEYTKFLFQALFELAKEENLFSIEHKGCIVLEEAHTLIPEWNMVGGSDKISAKLTNTIAQIALQGRKYNIGLLVIAQRTANISKTILTQCNTIISFKQLDNTSRDFLINHFGEEFVKVLPSLKFRQAIIAGKALVSDMPIMFKVPELLDMDIQEEVNQNEEESHNPYLENGALVEDTDSGQYQGNTDFNV